MLAATREMSYSHMKLRDARTSATFECLNSYFTVRSQALPAVLSSNSRLHDLSANGVSLIQLKFGRLLLLLTKHLWLLSLCVPDQTWNAFSSHQICRLKVLCFYYLFSFSMLCSVLRQFNSNYIFSWKRMQYFIKHSTREMQS